MRGSPFSKPPRALRGRYVRLDNLALVPASLLESRAKYQSIANDLPQGTVLIVLPQADSPTKQTLQKVAERLRAKGQSVTVLPVTRVNH